MSIKFYISDIPPIRRPGLQLLLLRCMLMCLLLPVTAWAQEASEGPAQALEPIPMASSCKIEINNATDNFEIGRVNDTIRILTPCLENDDIEKDDRVEMYRLLALSHLAKRDSARAYSYVQDLLKNNRRFKSRSVEDDPQFQAWVEELRPKWHERWLWRGVMAGGVAGAVLGYRAVTADDRPLPFPPTGPQ